MWRFVTIITGTYHLCCESDWLSPCHCTISIKGNFKYDPIYTYFYQVVSFFQVSPPEICTHFFSLPYMLHAMPISSSICSPLKIFDDKYVSVELLICSCLQSPATFSLPGTYLFLNTLFLNTLSVCVPLNMTDQVSHPKQWTKWQFWIFNLNVVGYQMGGQTTGPDGSRHSSVDQQWIYNGPHGNKHYLWKTSCK